MSKSDLDLLLKNKSIASNRVLDWVGTYTKAEICDIIGVSRPTLNSRLKKHNWRYKEIETIYNKLPF